MAHTDLNDVSTTQNINWVLIIIRNPKLWHHYTANINFIQENQAFSIINNSFLHCWQLQLKRHAKFSRIWRSLARSRNSLLFMENTDSAPCTTARLWVLSRERWIQFSSQNLVIWQLFQYYTAIYVSFMFPVSYNPYVLRVTPIALSLITLTI